MYIVGIIERREGLDEISLYFLRIKKRYQKRI